MGKKIRCYKIKLVPKSVLEPYLREEDCYNFLTADRSISAKIPVEEAVPLKIMVSNFIPEAGFWDEVLPCYFWKDGLWVEAQEFEDKLCPILAFDDGTIEDTAESG